MHQQGVYQQNNSLLLKNTFVDPGSLKSYNIWINIKIKRKEKNQEIKTSTSYHQGWSDLHTQSYFIGALLCDPGHKRVDGAHDDHHGARHQEDHRRSDNPGNWWYWWWWWQHCWWLQIWVNIIYDKKSPFCNPFVFFWENTCKTSQELSGHYDCHALRFSIVRNVNNFTTSLGLPFEGWSGDVQSIRSKQIIIHLGPSGLLSIDCKSLLVFAWYSMVLDGPETPESHWYYWNVPGWLA